MSFFHFCEKIYQIDLGVQNVRKTNLLETLKYVECRAFLQLVCHDDKTGENLRDMAGKIVRTVYQGSI